jgi:hypothetical protein
VRANLHVMLSNKTILDPLGWKDNQGILDPLGWNMRGTATTVPFLKAVVMEKA